MPFKEFKGQCLKIVFSRQHGKLDAFQMHSCIWVQDDILMNIMFCTQRKGNEIKNKSQCFTQSRWRPSTLHLKWGMTQHKSKFDYYCNYIIWESYRWLADSQTYIWISTATRAGCAIILMHVCSWTLLTKLGVGQTLCRMREYVKYFLNVPEQKNISLKNWKLVRH